MSALVLKSINKIYHGGHRAIRELNLEIGEKEFLVLSGPDGFALSPDWKRLIPVWSLWTGKM